MGLVVHVDKVDDDDSAEITQPQLACDYLRRFQIGLEDGVIEIASTDESTRVDVNRGQLTARLQRDAARQRPFNFFFNAIQLEQGAITRVVMNPIGESLNVVFCE